MSFNGVYLESLPIKIPKTVEDKRLVSRIIQKAEKILQRSKPKKLLEGFPETYLNEYRSKGIEMDEIKYTFNADHQKLKPFLTGQLGKGYAVYPDKGEDPIWAGTKEKARYIMLALDQKTVRQNDCTKILVPRDDSIIAEVLDKFAKTVKDIESIKIEHLEKEIDELVYRLYDLSKKDRDVVENFLAKHFRD